MGEIADGVNALISLGRGDVAGATLSAASMLPIVGDAIGKGGKVFRAATRHGDGIAEAASGAVRAGLVHEKPASKTPLGAGRRGALREAKRNNRIPTSQSPEEQTPNYDKRGHKQPGRQYKYRDSEGNPVTIRDDSKGHTYSDNSSQNRGPHFNDEAGNHYDY